MCIYIYVEIACKLWRDLYDACHPVFLLNSHIVVNATGLSLVAMFGRIGSSRDVNFPFNWATSAWGKPL